MRFHHLASLVLLASPAALGANSPPDVDESTFDTDEDKPLAATLRARDDDNDALVFKLMKPPKNGEATIAANGKLSYTPKKDWHGKDELSFEVSDGKARVVRKATIAVSSSNDPPTATGAELKGTEDKPVRGQIVAKDPDNDPITFAVVDDPASGSMEIEARTGRFVFNPGANQAGTVKLVVRMSDGTVDVNVPVTIVLDPLNDPPEAGEQRLGTKEDAPLKGKLAGTDVDNDALSWTLTDRPSHGAVEIDGAKGTFAYTPAKEYAGDDSFAFSVSDGKLSAKGRVLVEVQNVNDPPTIYPLALEGSEDQPLKGKMIAKDFDGDEVFFSVKTDPKHGDVEIDRSTGELTFAPAADYFGADTFTVEASDIAGGVSTAVTVTIKPVNDVPIAVSDSAKGDEDQPAAGKLKATDTEKDALTYSLAKPTKNGSVEIKADGAFRFVPNASFHGEDSFQFEVSDGKGKAQGTIQIIVKPVNDVPKTSDVAVATNEDTSVKGTVVGSDIDKDKLTFTLGKQSKKGKVTLDEEKGSFVYQPSPHENGADAFSVKVSDGTAEAEANVTVTIAAVNDAPVAAAHDGKGDEDQPIKGNAVASDVDKDTLTFTVITKPRAGTVEIDGRTGAYTYAPNAQFNGADGFRFEVSDGKLRSAADVKLAIAAVNDAPDTKPVAIKAIEDKAVAGAVAASDIDKDKLTWSEAKAPQKGKVAVDAATGRFTYTPNLNENGADTFVIAIADGNARSEATVTVAIEPVNDAPVADAHENRGKEDEPIKGKLSGSDLDKDTLTFIAATKPRLGSLDLDPTTGAYTYTPRAHENGADDFKLEVTDGKLRASANVKLVVAAVNDTPQPKDLAVAGIEDREASGKLLASDIDKDALTFRLKKAPANGLVIVDDATGSFRYAPTLDKHGPDTFVIEASDGFAVADATVTIAVAAMPDAPFVDPRPIETSEDEAVTVKLAAIDPDGEDTSFKILTQSRLGAAEIDKDGKTLRFSPHADQHGEDQLVVEASDGKNKVRAVLPVLVAARNDVPVIDAVSAKTAEETPIVIALVAHDKDGDPLKLALASAKGDAKPEPKPEPKGAAKAPAKGAAKAEPTSANAEGPATLTGNVLRIVPRKDFAGPIEVTVVPSDPSGNGAPLKIVVTVVNVNDAPVAKDLALKATATEPLNGVLEASDVDAGDELTFTVAVPPRQGAVTIADAKAGRFTYTAAAGASGEDSFRLRVRDKAGASVAATVRVTLTGAKPIAAAAPRAP